MYEAKDKIMIIKMIDMSRFNNRPKLNDLKEFAFDFTAPNFHE